MTDATLDDFPVARSRTIPIVGGWAVALGSLSVVVTTLFYVLSPPAAVAPVLLAPADALAAAAAGAKTMQIAGTSGVFGNLVMAVGVLMLTIERGLEGRAVAAAGWAAIFLSIIVFEIVDCLVGFVLSSAATDAAGQATFGAFRNIFAVYFLVGTVLFGAGGILALTDTAMTNNRIRLVTWAGRLNGAIAVVAGLATFAGFALPRLAGASVGVGAIIFVVVGLAVAREALYAETAVRRP